MSKIINICAAITVLGISGTASAWSIEGKVDMVDVRSGPTNYVYVAPKTALPTHRYLMRVQLDQCVTVVTTAAASNATVNLSGTGNCAATGSIRNCPNVATRCLIYRNR